MAAGLPVIARNTSAIPYVVPHEQAGLLFSTHDELVQSIITLYTTEGLKKRFGAYGKQHVHQNFTWDTSIKKLLALYEEFKP